MHVDAIEKTIRSIPTKKLSKGTFLYCFYELSIQTGTAAEFIAKVKETSDIVILPSEADIVFQLFSNKNGELVCLLFNMLHMYHNSLHC